MSTIVEEMKGSYEIKNNQREVLSLALSNYTYHAHATHGMTYIKSSTFNWQNGKLYQLKDLFEAGSDYVKRLSDLVRVQIHQRDTPFLNGFTAIQPILPTKRLSSTFSFMRLLHMFLVFRCF
ncbi:hypothetical protein [Pseudobacillus wudalianchiensis]|uniref:hypothetical protein n=1 Tax=Pseudobacillus wudalianchiensis TaxID=1743143 RepID=UPI00269C3708